MVRITEDLIRKRAEHNECIISTLEEISLHQQDIEKIEHIGRWCKSLKILYLQSNLIPKIENIGRLKELDYINLALNNIERVENLEGCESLRKLDLTVNFVGQLTSISSLKSLVHFRELFLTGNPCVNFEGYRDYVIATLPQLKYLDGIEIEKSERIKAIQMIHELQPSIVQQEKLYQKKRDAEKKSFPVEVDNIEEELKPKNDRWYTDTTPKLTPQEQVKIQEDDFKKEKEYWQEKTDYTPESRIEMHKHVEKQKAEKNKERPGPDPQPRERRLVMDDGTMLNVNECKFDFRLTEDDDGNFLLDLPLYKHLSSELIDADVQPTYVRVTVKGKVFQLVLPEEVLSDKSQAQRSEITGHLLLKMPKASYTIIKEEKKRTHNIGKQEKEVENNDTNKNLLEFGNEKSKCPDIFNIVQEKDQLSSNFHEERKSVIKERPNSKNFVDDISVPPLI